MKEPQHARLVGTVVLATAAAGVWYIGGIALVLQCVLIMVVGVIVHALLMRNHNVLAALLMPAALFAIFPSKRVRSLLDKAKRHDEARQAQTIGDCDVSGQPDRREPGTRVD